MSIIRGPLPLPLKVEASLHDLKSYLLKKKKMLRIDMLYFLQFLGNEIKSAV